MQQNNKPYLAQLFHLTKMHNFAQINSGQCERFDKCIFIYSYVERERSE